MATPRNVTPSRAVIGGASVGAPLALILSWATARYAPGLPPDVLMAGASILTAGVSWLFRGGRKGEAD